jgi:hypothetical protein
MKRTLIALGVAVGLLAGGAETAEAQSRVGDDGWWSWAVPTYESNRGRDTRQGQGPPFCRNGRGHPVHGLEWCRAKGWNATWQRTVWDDVVLRIPRERDRRVQRQETLAETLGRVVFGRLDGERRNLGVNAPLEGRWLTARGGAQVLQVRAGGIPIAELTDRNGDGRVDVVLINRP